VTGPSALVSWLEPLVLQLSYQISVATAALLDRLTDRAAIITTKGKSFRMRRRNQAATPDPEAAEPAAPRPTPKPR